MVESILSMSVAVAADAAIGRFWLDVGRFNY